MLTLSEARPLAERAREAAKITRDSYQSHWIEDDITREFMSNISNELNDTGVNQYLVNTAKVQDHSSHAVESIIGADFFIVLIFATRHGITGTGVISQAKWAKPWEDNFDVDGMVEDVQEDCEDMLQVTSSSFGTIYYSDTFRFFPANQLPPIDSDQFNNTARQLYYQVPNRAVYRFFIPLFRGFRGDKYIYEHMEELLNVTDSSEIPPHNISTDGGNEPELGDNNTTHGVVILLSKEDSEYPASEELPFDNDDILSDLNI